MRANSAAHDVSHLYRPAVPPTPKATLGAKLILDLNSDITIPGTGSGVGVWPDQSGTGNDVSQGVAANQPPRIANALGSHPALSFVAVSQYFLSRNPGFTGAPAGSLLYHYTVCDLTVMGATAGVWETSNANLTARGFSCLFRTAGTAVIMAVVTATGNNQSSNPTITTGPKLYGAAQVGSVLSNYQNNVLIAAPVGLDPAGTTNAADRIFIGCWPDNTFYANAKLYRVLIAVNPTAAQHAAVLNHLRYTYPSIGIAV